MKEIIYIVLVALFIIPVYTDAKVPVPKNRCDIYATEIQKYQWDSRITIAIMKLESGCNPKAINHKDGHGRCTGSYSLMQVACIHYKVGQNKLDPNLNIKIAYRVYKEAGNSFRPWTTCKKVKGCK